MRTPEQIIGADALLQLNFEGYEVVKIGRPETLDVGPSEFDTLWDMWPHKTAKKAAEKAYKAARKRGISQETMGKGVIIYRRDKPADRPWMHLSTFINGERWNDQPAAVVAKGLAGVRANLQQEISDANRSAGQTGDYHSNAGRLAIGSRFDDERHGRRLL